MSEREQIYIHQCSDKTFKFLERISMYFVVNLYYLGWCKEMDYGCYSGDVVHGFHSRNYLHVLLRPFLQH